MSFISSFEIIDAFCFAKFEGRVSDPTIFLWIAASLAAAAAAAINHIKTLSGNGLSTFTIEGNPVFSNGLKSLPKNSLDCPILCNLSFC